MATMSNYIFKGERKIIKYVGKVEMRIFVMDEIFLLYSLDFFDKDNIKLCQILYCVNILTNMGKIRVK